MAISQRQLLEAQRARMIASGQFDPNAPKIGAEGYSEAYRKAYLAAGSSHTAPVPIETARQIIRSTGGRLPGIDIGGTLGDQLPSGITLSLSSTERQQLVTQQAQATCEADRQKLEPKVYKASLKGGGFVLVEAPDKKVAQQRATEAGYNVQRITWSPSYGEPERAATKVTGSTIKVKDGNTGETIEFSKAGWDAWPDKYKRLVTAEGYDAALRAFNKDYYECADGQFILKTDFYALPTKYADIAATQGFAAMQTRFEADHVKLGDGQWMAKADWDALMASDKANDTTFTDIAKRQGYDALVVAIDKANEPYGEFLKKVERGDLIPIAGGQYITKEEFNKLPSGSQQILKEQGFQAFEDIGVKKWQDVSDPSKTLTDDEFQKLCDQYDAKVKTTAGTPEFYELGEHPHDQYHLDADSSRRLFINLASMIAPPARAGLPEYTLKDITSAEWALAGINGALLTIGFAPGAITGSIAGKAVAIGLSTTLGGIIGYETGKNWANLTPGQRALGVGMTVLCAIPLITTVARNVKTSGPTIPTAKGNVVAWKGLSVAGHPIIGRSGGKWVVGTRGITLPEARMILNGYKPEMMLETKVFVNETALKAAGFTKDQIDYLNTTLKARNLFAGKSSPWLDKNVLVEPTQRLNSNEISTIMQRLTKLDQAKLKNAHMLYGSPTIKAQLAPELRGWRAIHDWDISLNMNQAQTEAFTRSLLKNLQAKGGGTYRINPQKPTLIEKNINGTFKGNHIVDIHSMEEVASTLNLPASKLDATGTYSYGRMVSEPAITVKYPGVGDLRIMRLSESGVRKADTILRVRQTAEGTAFRPPERGIAQPGVPKDAADFYVTLRTFKGETIAEEWLESWAKAMGYTKAEMAKVLPRIRQQMLEVAANTPSDIIGYQFSPASSAKVSTGASPSVIIHIPASLGASVSPKLESQISKPIYPYKLAQSPRIQTATSLALSSMVSKAPSTMRSLAKVSPSVSRSLVSANVSPKPSPSPAVSKVSSPSPKLSPSTVPSLSASVKPSPSARPSKAPSPTPSPKPSPTPSPTPTPSPKPSPYPYPYPKPGPKPKPLPRMPKPAQSKQTRIRSGPALATWRQGAYWVSVFPPFRTTGRKEDVVYSKRKPPWASVIARGRHSPRATLKSIGKVPKLVEVPMGVVTARIKHGKHLTFSRSNGRRRGRILE